MDLSKSQTLSNLVKAFAGECQAGARYQFLAKKAKSEDYCYLETLLKELATNEMSHAKIFFDLITEDMQAEIKNIRVDGGYPFYKGTIEEELAFSAHNELEEHQRIYPSFARTAKEEGFTVIALKFDQIAQIESAHHAKLTQLAALFKSGQLYLRPTAVKWKCVPCGYETTAKGAPKTCPLCGYQQGEVEIVLAE